MILIYVQRILAVLSLIVGVLTTFSETPITDGIKGQIFVTFEGIALIIVSVGWLYLIKWEETKLETRA